VAAHRITGECRARSGGVETDEVGGRTEALILIWNFPVISIRWATGPRKVLPLPLGVVRPRRSGGRGNVAERRGVPATGGDAGFDRPARRRMTAGAFPRAAVTRSSSRASPTITYRYPNVSSACCRVLRATQATNARSWQAHAVPTQRRPAGPGCRADGIYASIYPEWLMCSTGILSVPRGDACSRFLERHSHLQR